ncbi:MAG: hypothetical protein DRP42_03905 [Tenericutes bacterium]|nr:MAG: hypothetical protein DRP42_03905 [Mycoplasmatota bacterium]
MLGSGIASMFMYVTIAKKMMANFKNAQTQMQNTPGYNPEAFKQAQRNAHSRQKDILDEELRKQGIDIDELNKKFGDHLNPDNNTDVTDIEEKKED